MLGLELDSESDLPLSSAQDLYRLAERLEWHIRPAPDGGRVLAVEHVEELDQHLRLGTRPVIPNRLETRMSRLTKGGALNALRPASTSMAFTDAVAIRIDENAGCGLPAEMEPALRPEDPADQNLVRQLDEPVELEHMIDRQIGRSLVAVGAVQKRSGLLDERAVGAAVNGPLTFVLPVEGSVTAGTVPMKLSEGDESIPSELSVASAYV